MDNHSLPSDQYTGEVAGVRVSYNEETANNVRELKNPSLKRTLERFAIRAASERGFSAVMIRSIFHPTTVLPNGDKVPAPLHLTISAGSKSTRAHIEVTGVDIADISNPATLYDDMSITDIKWKDQATSVNVSPEPQTPGSPPTQTPDAPTQDPVPPQWYPTGYNIPGLQWAWWDGTKYTGQYQ